MSRTTEDMFTAQLRELRREFEEKLKQHEHPGYRNRPVPGAASGGVTSWAFASDDSIRNYASGSPRKNVVLADAWETVGSAISIGGTDGNEFTINENGLYLVSAQTECGNNGSAGRRTLVFEHSSGLPYNGDPLDDDNDASTSISTDLGFCIPLPLSAGDVMRLKFMQTSGSSVQLFGAFGGIVQLAAS